MASILAAPPAQPALPLIGLGAAIGALELVCGFVYPAMALSLEARGASLALIGCQAAMVGVGLTLSALLVPWLSGRLGALRLGRANLALASLAVLAFGLVEGVGWWFALALLLGVTINIWYVQSETWINQLAQDHSRGRTVGLVGGLREGAGACGPLLIPLLGVAGPAPYALMALAVAAAGLALPGLRPHLAQPRAPQPKEFLATVRVIPVLLLAVVVSGYSAAPCCPSG